MPNDQSHDTRTTDPLARAVRAVNLNVAYRAAQPPSGGPDGSLIFDAAFPEQDDWAVQHARQIYLYEGWTGDDGSSGYVAGNNLPPGFHYMYMAETMHPNGDKNGNNAVPGSQPVAQISSLHGNMDSPTGKSWIMYDEPFGKPTDWGADSVMTRDLGAEYSELYFETHMRFSPDWVWHNDTGFTPTGEAGDDPAMKFLRCRRHTDPSVSRFAYTGIEARQGSPVCIFDLKAWNPTGTKNIVRPLCALRGYVHPDDFAPDDYYQMGDYQNAVVESVWKESGESLAWPELIGQWVKVGLLVKMDSTPGAKDGQVKVWINDILAIDREDVPWRQVGDPHPMGWNEISLGGNLNNSPFAEEEQIEQWYQVHNLKVYYGRPV